MLNRHQRRAQYAKPSRSKPYCVPRNPKAKSEAVIRGYKKIMAFIERGLRLNAKVVKVNPLAAAIKRGIHGMQGMNR